MKSLLTLCCLAFLSVCSWAQELPQTSKPAPSPERQREIRDSIRARAHSPVTFVDKEEREGKISYEADRALLMPAMERSSIFRIGIPGWIMRLSLRAGRNDFDSDEEYRTTRYLLKRIKGLRLAAWINNEAYNSKKLLKQYLRYANRKGAEPVLQVRAPGGGVQIHVKVRRGKVKRMMLLAYGAEGGGDAGAALIRMRTKIREEDLQKALALMTESAEEEAGIRIDTESL